MARIYSTKDRIKLHVEERKVKDCETCGATGEVSKPSRMRCPVCQGFKQLPGNEVVSTVTYEISPLNWERKQEILSQNRIVSGQIIEDDSRRTFLAMKYGIKAVDGFKWFDPAKNEEVDWKPEFDQAGNLTDESVEWILNTSMTAAVTQFAKGLVGGIPQFLINQATGLPMTGVRIELPGDDRKKA